MASRGHKLNFAVTILNVNASPNVCFSKNKQIMARDSICWFLYPSISG